MLLWVNVIAHAFLGWQWCLPNGSQKAEVPWVPESFQEDASGSPTASREDFGDDGVPQGLSCLKVTSLLSDLTSFADSVVLGLVCKLSSPGSRFDPSSTGCHSSRYAFWNVSPVQDDRSRERTQRNKGKR